MYYLLYNNPFYYPCRAYMPYGNMCSYNYVPECNHQDSNIEEPKNVRTVEEKENFNFNCASTDSSHRNNINNDFFSVFGDRLEIFGISINIDDLIILIMLFFMFRENNIDYSIIIILALILFDQS